MMSEDSSTAGTDNRPPMLEESDYESWKIRIKERNAELEQETELLKTTLRNKEATIASLTSETKTVISEKNTLEDKYLEEIVCLKNANQVATGLLQKFQMPTQTIPMLSKRPMIASNDIHKTGLDSEYEQTVLANKNLQIEKKNLLIKNECLIFDSISKDICSIVLASVKIVPPISDCMCAELGTSCDREHNRVLELEAEISKLHNMLKESKKCCVFIQKDHIDLQNNGYKIEIANHTRRCLELLKASTHSCNTSNEKIDALNAEIAKMKPSGSGTKVSGPKTLEKPKVLAPWMCAISSKYITPPRRGD
nr:hypothetical protein [Tanacetum cinerariifolium]